MRYPQAWVGTDEVEIEKKCCQRCGGRKQQQIVMMMNMEMDHQRERERERSERENFQNNEF